MQSQDAQGPALSHECLMHVGSRSQLAHTSLALGRVLPCNEGYGQYGDVPGELFSRDSQAHVDGKLQLAHTCLDLRKDELESAGWWQCLDARALVFSLGELMHA